MNAHDLRTPSDVQLQAQLERMLAARRAADAAREARFRRLPTPSTRPVPIDDEPPIVTVFIHVLAALLLWAVFGWGVIALIAWWQA